MEVSHVTQRLAMATLHGVSLGEDSKACGWPCARDTMGYQWFQLPSPLELCVYNILYNIL